MARVPTILWPRGLRALCLLFAVLPLGCGQQVEPEATARLIVLGACETSYTGQASDWTLPAQSDPASAFIHAGAHQVVSSVLPAHDEGTGALVRAFYRHLPDRDAVTALALAQRERAVSTPPALWAGFRISGSFLTDAAQRSAVRQLLPERFGRSRQPGDS